MSIDIATTTTNSQTLGSALSFTHDSGTGTNRILIVFASMEGTASQNGAVYGTQTMTAIYTNGSANAGFGAYYLLAPATGTNTLTVTWSFALAGYKQVTAVTFENVSQTDPSASFKHNGASLGHNSTLTVSDAGLSTQAMSWTWTQAVTASSWYAHGALRLDEVNSGLHSMYVDSLVLGDENSTNIAGGTGQTELVNNLTVGIYHIVSKKHIFAPGKSGSFHIHKQENFDFTVR